MARVGRAFRIDNPDAAAILEMQGARIARPRLAGQREILILPMELAEDRFFMTHTFPYVNPGSEINPQIPPPHQQVFLPELDSLLSMLDNPTPRQQQVYHNYNQHYSQPMIPELDFLIDML